MTQRWGGQTTFTLMRGSIDDAEKLYTRDRFCLQRGSGSGGSFLILGSGPVN